MEVIAETYDDWIATVSNLWLHRRTSERWGQFLWNRMPNRFCNRVPRGFDPFYDDKNVENFLLWLKEHW